MLEHVTPVRVAEIIAAAPGWARAGITAPDRRMRESALATLAEAVCAQLDEPPGPCRHPGQLALPL